MIRSAVVALAAALTLGACGNDDGATAPSASSVPGGLQGNMDGVAGNSLAPDGAIDAQSLQQQLSIQAGDRVLFDTDQFELSGEAQTVLQKQAAWLAAHPSVTVSIEGNADERGTREYNLALGDRRANSIRNYLVALGVDGGRMSAISYGKERPECEESSDACWAQNRRGTTVITQ
jgi:peptidoglycan-associated lipoprotein